MVASLTALLVLFAVLNCIRSLRGAYQSGLNLKDGGYPIYGDAFQNAMAIGLAAFFSGLTTNIFSSYQRAIAWSAIAMLVINVTSIALLVKAGDRRRLKGIAE